MSKKGKIALGILLGCVIASMIVRILVVVGHTDMQTGFIFRGEELISNLPYFGIIIASAAVCFFAVGNEKGPKGGSELSGGKTAVIGFLTMLSGIFAIFEGIYETKAITPNVFLIISDFVLGAALVIISFAALYKKRFTPGLGFSYILLALYTTARGIYCFMSRMAIVTVPEYLIELLSIICMGFFFAVFARYLTGVVTPRTKRFASFWGVSGAAFSLSTGIGTYIVKLTAPAEISARIALTSYQAESFRQACKGVNAYMLTATPTVNILLGLLAAVGTVFMLSKKDNT